MKAWRVNRVLIALLILSLPLAEFLVFRVLLHSVLGVRIGWGPLMVDADLAVPLVPAFLIYFYTLSEKQLPSVSVQRKILSLNLALFVIFLVANLFYNRLLVHLGIRFQAVWWGIALGLLGSASFVWVAPKFYLTHSNRLMVVSCAVMALSIILAKHLFESTWTSIAHAIATYSCPKIQMILSEPVLCRVMVRPSGEHVLRMTGQSVRAFIGHGCGGLDGLVFFLNLSIVLWIHYRETLCPIRWVAASSLGLGLIFFLINPLRIGFLYIVAVEMDRHFPSGYAQTIFQWVFHAHAGWLFYLLFGAAFYLKGLPLLAKDSQKQMSGSRFFQFLLTEELRD